MADKLQEFVDYLKKTKGLSDKTVYHYLTYHRHFMDQEISQKSINAFVQKKHNNSVCRGYIKSYLEFLKRDKEFDLPKIKSGSGKRRLIRPITLQEIQSMRDLAYQTKVRDGVILDLLYYGALRRAEILTIKTNSFNWDQWFKDTEDFCEFNVIGKRNKERTVLVHPKAMNMILKTYLSKGVITPHMEIKDILEKLKSMDDLLFPKLSEWVIWKLAKKYSLRALKRSVRTHEIRHARATELEILGASIREIQIYLGHGDLRTTEIYLHTDKSKSLAHIKSISKDL